MKNHKIIVSYILPLIESTLLSVGVAIFLKETYRMSAKNSIIFLMCVVFSSLVLLFDLYKKRVFTYIILLGVFLFGVFFIKTLKLPFTEWMMFLYKEWGHYYGDALSYPKGFSYVFIIVLSFLSSVIFYMLHKIKFPRYIFACILPLLLITLAVMEQSLDKITIGLFLFYVLSVLVEVLGRLYHKETIAASNRMAALYLAPVYMIILLLAVALPSKEEPISWKGIKKLVAVIEEKSTILIQNLEHLFSNSGTEYSLNFGGYGGDNESILGGSMFFQDKTSLKVRSFPKTVSTGYLSGSIYDVYTGSSWAKSTDTEYSLSKESYYDYLELMQPIGKGLEEGKELDDFVAEREYSVEYYDIQTKTLFFPLKSYKIDVGKKEGYIETELGNLVYGKPKGRGFEYKVYFYELNLTGDAFINILREEDDDIGGERDSLEQWGMKTFLEKYGEVPETKELDDMLKRRRENIYDQYTKLPDTLTDRTVQLAFDLTKNYNNDYDKLKSIELFLTNYNYTTKVSDIPEETDFVDYFLFQGKKGYCTYYATAMSVLARIVNIPTRYVEGYVLNYGTIENINTYIVKGENAHAWVEAYIKGVGWIPFEPTPGYHTSRYTRWQEEDLYPFDYNTEQYYENNIKNSLDTILEETSDDEGAKEIKNKSGNQGMKIVLTIFAFLTIILLSFLLYYYFLERKYKKICKLYPSSKGFRILLSELLLYLKLDGYKIAEGETLLTYALRIGNRVQYEEMDFYQITKLYNQSRYGSIDLEKEEFYKIQMFVFQYRIVISKKVGIIKIFFHRFLYLNSINE